MTRIIREGDNVAWFDMAEGWPMWRPKILSDHMYLAGRPVKGAAFFT